jgi:hypothetical protein
MRLSGKKYEKKLQQLEYVPGKYPEFDTGE